LLWNHKTRKVVGEFKKSRRVSIRPRYESKLQRKHTIGQHVKS